MTHEWTEYSFSNGSCAAFLGNSLPRLPATAFDRQRSFVQRIARRAGNVRCQLYRRLERQLGQQQLQDAVVVAWRRGCGLRMQHQYKLPTGAPASQGANSAALTQAISSNCLVNSRPIVRRRWPRQASAAASASIRCGASSNTTVGLTTGRSFGDAGVEMLGGSAPIYLLHKATGTKCFGSAARSFRKCPITHPTVCAQARTACRGDRLQ